MKRIVLSVIVIIGLLFSENVFAQQDSSFPVPTGNPNQLFYLQRTPNKNTIVCEINRKKDGTIDKENPIHVFWIRYGEKGQRAELSSIQRKFAYGVKAKKIEENKYELHFVSFPKYKMYLIITAENKFYVVSNINQKMAVLKSIFVKINGGSFWFPKVEYAELKGLDPANGVVLKEKMKV